MPVARVPLPDAFLGAPFAHRALHDRAAGRPENSRAAVRAAIAAGYGIEIDIQPSADGVPMVFHDYDLRRLTGESGRIRGRTAQDLQAIPLLGGDEGIPTLADILTIVAGRVPLLVEIKDQDGAMGEAVGHLELAVARALQPYQGPVALMSFNPNAVVALATYAPHLPRGLTTSAYRPEDWPLLPAPVRDRLREIPDMDRTGASFISHEAADLSRVRVAELKAQGHAVLCWTIRSPQAEAEARKVADNVTFEGYAPPIPGPTASQMHATVEVASFPAIAGIPPPTGTPAPALKPRRPTERPVHDAPVPLALKAQRLGRGRHRLAAASSGGARATARSIAVAPLYAKAHSQGEYIFDHNWADAWQNARRALLSQAADRRALHARPPGGAS